jgi:ATP-binding cassette subfamily F protein 3
MTSLQLIGTLSGGQKSRVSFAVLSMQKPHILLLDEPTNHLDIEGLDALMDALKVWNGGVIAISHDSTVRLPSSFPTLPFSPLSKLLLLCG